RVSPGLEATKESPKSHNTRHRPRSTEKAASAPNHSGSERKRRSASGHGTAVCARPLTARTNIEPKTQPPSLTNAPFWQLISNDNKKLHAPTAGRQVPLHRPFR